LDNFSNKITQKTEEKCQEIHTMLTKTGADIATMLAQYNGHH
jgi:hypothetical protein